MRSIMAINIIPDPDNLRIGQVLLIPDAEILAPPPAQPIAPPIQPADPQPHSAPAPPIVEPLRAPARRTHTVQPRDELRYIAERYGVSMRGIMAINAIPDPDNLRIGQVLLIPDPGR
jgi:nucleoid-associated protein YgaU